MDTKSQESPPARNPEHTDTGILAQDRAQEGQKAGSRSPAKSTSNHPTSNHPTSNDTGANTGTDTGDTGDTGDGSDTAPESMEPVQYASLFRNLSETAGNPEFARYINAASRQRDRPGAQVTSVPNIISNIAAAAALVARLAGHCGRGHRGRTETEVELKAIIAVGVIAARSLVRHFPACTPRLQFEAAMADMTSRLILEDYLNQIVMHGAPPDFRDIEARAREIQASWPIIGLRTETMGHEHARTAFVLAPELIALEPQQRRAHYQRLSAIFVGLQPLFEDDERPVFKTIRGRHAPEPVTPVTPADTPSGQQQAHETHKEDGFVPWGQSHAGRTGHPKRTYPADPTHDGATSEPRSAQETGQSGQSGQSGQ